MAAVLEKGRRGLEAGVRDGRLQERHHLQGSPVREDPTWDPEDARWSVIRWVAEPVAKRHGAARARSALGRNHLRPHHLLARHPQATQNSGISCSARRTIRGRTQAAAARRADRRAAALRGVPTRSATRSGCGTTIAPARLTRSNNSATRHSRPSTAPWLRSCRMAGSTTWPSRKTASST